MKKIFLVLLATIAMFSCSSANDKEKNEARELLKETFVITNEQMRGMAIDEVTVCDSCVFKNDRIYYYYTIDEEYLPISQIEAEKSARGKNIKSFIDNSAEMAVLVDLLKKLDDGGFTYVYRGNVTGDVTSMEIDY